MSSPLPKKKFVKDMFTFPEAIMHILDGKKVTKLEWANPAEYVFLKDGFLCIHHSGDDELFHRLIVSEADMRGEDWQLIVEEEYVKS